MSETDKSFNRDQFFLEEWPNALRSGEYKQGTGTLLRNTSDGDLYCCLGVACDLLEKKGLLLSDNWIQESNLPDRAKLLLGIDEDGSLWLWEDESSLSASTSLVDINDNGNFSFSEIADIIVLTYKRNGFYPAYDDEDDDYD